MQPQTRMFDGFNRTTGQKTEVVGIRIFAAQKEKLHKEYDGNTSALVRILLEKFFAGELPKVEDEFKQSLSHKQL